MNIIIPLAGRGERFVRQGFQQPKPLIPIFDKCMIQYVLDNIHSEPEDRITILYASRLDSHGFASFMKQTYPLVELIPVPDTRGAVETVALGIKQLLPVQGPCLLLDCDTFYTQNVVEICRQSLDNVCFYVENTDPQPVYSYLELDPNGFITNIREKEKISDHANTGAYFFREINELFRWCQYVLENGIQFQGEPYTSCIISEMIQAGITFRGACLRHDCVFSLGTPTAVHEYMERTHAFLFDLDGTLVITDDIYFRVWSDILACYNIVLDDSLFRKVIQGNNDKYVMQYFHLDVSPSDKKDRLFIENIDSLRVIPGVHDMLEQICLAGHKICIVTNCNRPVAEKVIQHIGASRFIDFIISSQDCVYGKPHPEPYEKAIQRYNIPPNRCYIFEDSKTGILSGLANHPRSVIGIETLYDKEEMTKVGVDLSLADFVGFDPLSLMDNKCIHNMYVERILASIPNISTAAVDKPKMKGGFIADIQRVIATMYDGSTIDCVFKYENTQENILSWMANKLELYEREYSFYKDVAKRVPVSIPHFYGLVYDEQNKPCGFLLENLLKKGMVPNLNLNTEKIDVALKVVDRMACLHSTFWNKPLKKIFPCLREYSDTLFTPFLHEFVLEKYPLFQSKWGTILNPTQQQMMKTIHDQYADIQERFSGALHITFVHGDIKSPNIFYDIANDCEPCFIDWQHCAIGKGAQDLVFFIIESFDMCHMKSFFHIMKHYYYKKLLEYGVQGYSQEDFDSDIYDSICFIPYFTSIWFGTIDQDELIDKNFPYFIINKMLYLLEIIDHNK